MVNERDDCYEPIIGIAHTTLLKEHVVCHDYFENLTGPWVPKLNSIPSPQRD
jgi:hypothetical protein